MVYLMRLESSAKKHGVHFVSVWTPLLEHLGVTSVPAPLFFRERDVKRVLAFVLARQEKGMPPFKRYRSLIMRLH